MRVRFWGTRGSLPTPGMGTVRYGGNTSCVEVHGEDGTRIVLDCGTGVRGLGEALLQSAADPPRGHLFITHTHWDHIQGFPFFRPLFVRDGEWDVYGPGTDRRGIDTTLGRLFDTAYFPVGVDQIEARLHFHTLTEGAVELNSARITAQYLNHPTLTLGYRVEMDGAILVYAVDHEPHSRQQPGPGRLLTARVDHDFVHPEDERHVDFLAGADLIIHDSMYTAQEYPDRLSWGHSSAEQSVDYAVAAEAKRLALFHHDLGRDDQAMDLLVESCRQRAEAAGSPIEVIGAKEGKEVNLGGSGLDPRIPARGVASPWLSASSGPPNVVLVVSPDTHFSSQLALALEADGLGVVRAPHGEAGRSLAITARPSLILLDTALPGRSGLDPCDALLAYARSRIPATPVIILGDPDEPGDVARAFAAGAIDYLTKPCKPTYVQARVWSWLLRSAGRAPLQGSRCP